MEDYWSRVRKKAAELQSDGCSGVLDVYLECCEEHDVHYRTHQTIDGKPITRAEADQQLRNCIQEKSRFGVFSPVSWWRWLGLRLVGGWAWEK